MFKTLIQNAVASNGKAGTRAFLFLLGNILLYFKGAWGDKSGTAIKRLFDQWASETATIADRPKFSDWLQKIAVQVEQAIETVQSDAAKRHTVPEHNLFSEIAGGKNIKQAFNYLVGQSSTPARDLLTLSKEYRSVPLELRQAKLEELLACPSSDASTEKDSSKAVKVA